MMDDSELQQRLNRLERRLQLLVSLAVAQTSLIVFLILWMIASSLVPNTPTLILMAVALVVVAYLLRHRIPGWLGKLTRLFFAQLMSSQEADVAKDPIANKEHK